MGDTTLSYVTGYQRWPRIFGRVRPANVLGQISEREQQLTGEGRRHVEIDQAVGLRARLCEVRSAKQTIPNAQGGSEIPIVVTAARRMMR